MRTYRLALIGFGTVGQGLAAILRDKADQLAAQFGARFVITAVCTSRRGAVASPAGLDPTELLAAIGRGGLGHLAAAQPWDAATTIAQAAADVLVETTWTDLTTGEPASGHLRQALARGLHVVTANKGPLALHGAEIADLARRQGRTLGYEATVMAGTPTIRLGAEALAGCHIAEVAGILNGTTNYMLTRMEAGADYAAALAEAQRLGYAEADPAGDVDGHDAAAKVAILSTLLLGCPLRPAQVATTGISGLTSAEIARAAAAGERWKLIGRLVREQHGVRAQVQPERVPLSHPLASVAGTTNAITYSTDLLGDITLVGSGAGGISTGFALLADLLAIHRAASPA